MRGWVGTDKGDPSEDAPSLPCRPRSRGHTSGSTGGRFDDWTGFTQGDGERPRRRTNAEEGPSWATRREGRPSMIRAVGRVRGPSEHTIGDTGGPVDEWTDFAQGDGVRPRRRTNTPFTDETSGGGRSSAYDSGRGEGPRPGGVCGHQSSGQDDLPCEEGGGVGRDDLGTGRGL